MTFSAMWPVIYLFTVVSALVFIVIVVVTVYRLSREAERRENLRRLLPWLIKGLVIPLALWVVMNLGISWQLQPFMPQVQAAQNSGTTWIPAFLRVIAAGLFAVSSYWAAVSLGWVLFNIGRGLEREDWSDYRALCLTSLIGMALPAIGLVWLGGWLTVGLALGLMFLPIVAYAPAVLHRLKRPPMYSSAIAKMNFGKYAEAEWEIIRQLEKWENDANGWLMLAELYANKFQDLAEAEQIVVEICDQPGVTPSQISVALHKLADWHLRLKCDPDAARGALQMICDRFPGTHLARMAELRCAQLPRTAAELREQRGVQVIPMPALSFEESTVEAEPPLEARQATALANELSERLTHNPDDIVSRERLARVLAAQLGQTDLAIEQIELLFGMPDPPDSKRAEWLGLIAAWQLKFNHDPKTARQIMERVVTEFPNSPQALAAQRRLNLMAMEQKVQQLRSSRPKFKIVHNATEPPTA
jgi:TolA-binding protein